jgi:YVTN family beta-propeller protein
MKSIVINAVLGRYRAFLLVVFAGVGLILGSALAHAVPLAYVTNAFSQSVSVIDTATNQLTGSITLAPNSVPFAAAVTPDGKFVYVTSLDATGTCGSATAVWVIGTASNTVVAGPIVVGCEPTSVAISPNGRHAYVANRLSSTLSVIDTQTNLLTSTVALPSGSFPAGLVVAPDGRYVYITLSNSHALLVVDTASSSVVGTPIAVGCGPHGIAITPDGAYVYVTNDCFPGGGVTVVSLSTNSAVAAISVGNNPSAAAITPDAKFVYVTNTGERSVSVIDAATNSVLGSPIPVDGFPGAIAIAPNGRQAYVTNEGGNTVSVIETASNTVSATIVGLSSPRGVAIAPANRPPDVSNAKASIEALWPPNHRMVTVSILGITDPDGDPVAIRVTSITQNEPTRGTGSGDACPDAAGIGNSSIQLRAERAGSGPGRLYIVSFVADDNRGGTSEGSVSVLVPHNQAKSTYPTRGAFDSMGCSGG